MMIMMMTVAVVVVVIVVVVVVVEVVLPERHVQRSPKVEDLDTETSCTGDIYWDFMNFTMADICTIPG
jgi:uncharacterized membrane protein